ncbi:Syntaxin-8 [Apodemus speciosus]|uniref:Syntaxin-8 n=1 Tax=Apodemus speciosus TaxID=105296 RepID=A0ABQ0FAH2_APOSI
MAPDPWFSTYDSTCQIAQEIAEKIQERNQCERRGEKTPKTYLDNQNVVEESEDVSMSSLMSEEAKRGTPNPWLSEEPEETRGLGFDEIRQQQQKIIQEQDAGLDALSSIISRQKQMGQEIGNELDEQNEIIDDLANLVENTDEKLRTEARRVTLVDRKSTSCEDDHGDFIAARGYCGCCSVANQLIEIKRPPAATPANDE